MTTNQPPVTKALTLHQPWASLVALGAKTIETRSWSTHHRGPIAIHAAKTVPGWVLPLELGGFTVERDNPPGTGPAYLLRGPIAWPYRLPLGAIVATATLVDCVPVPGDAPNEDGLRVLWSTFGQPGWTFAGIGDCFLDIGQRPFGDYSPGRWAWLLDDIAPTTERCPVCWRRAFLTGAAPERPVGPCPTCGGAGRSSGRCDPIPARGGRRLWNWEPHRG